MENLVNLSLSQLRNVPNGNHLVNRLHRLHRRHHRHHHLNLTRSFRGEFR